MIFKLLRTQPHDPTSTINMRCPSCRQRGTFESVNVQDLFNDTQTVRDNILVTQMFGQRRCPNPDCRAHIFFAYEPNFNRLIISYPAEHIDFDATDVPALVLKSFEEAITCHANQCYVASAIMVRKTLEELCRERGATGPNLKERIKALGTKVVLPQELLDGLDDLRLLGNDAAHIESQHYDKIGQEEVEIGIEVTKEVLKAVYQYTSLIKKLQGFKRNQIP